MPDFHLQNPLSFDPHDLKPEILPLDPGPFGRHRPIQTVHEATHRIVPFVIVIEIEHAQQAGDLDRSVDQVEAVGQ